MASESKVSKDGPQPDGSYIIDDTTTDLPTVEELRAMLRKKQEQPKPLLPSTRG